MGTCFKKGKSAIGNKTWNGSIQRVQLYPSLKKLRDPKFDLNPIIYTLDVELLSIHDGD